MKKYVIFGLLVLAAMWAIIILIFIKLDKDHKSDFWIHSDEYFHYRVFKIAFILGCAVATLICLGFMFSN